RAAVPARQQLLVRAVRLGQGEIAGQGDERAEPGPDRLQPVQVALRELDGGDLARAQHGPEVAHGGEEDLVGGHQRPPRRDGAASAARRAAKTVTGSSALPSLTVRSRCVASPALTISARTASRSAASSLSP